VKSAKDIEQEIAIGTDSSRQFNASTQLYIDKTTTTAPIKRIQNKSFLNFFEKRNGFAFSDSGLDLVQVLHNMNLAKDDRLTLAGLLLFGEDIQTTKPFCLIRAVSFYGDDISENEYIDKRDCAGNLEEQFQSAFLFLKNNLARMQGEGSFNSPGTLEISEQALVETLVNALLHRDYSKNAVVRLLVFKDRVEVISPGCLPNHLSVENIINGNSIMRNPLLASYGTKILPYSGLGSGIQRILKMHPETNFINDTDGEQFTVILKRPSKKL